MTVEPQELEEGSGLRQLATLLLRASPAAPPTITAPAGLDAPRAQLAKLVRTHRQAGDYRAERGHALQLAQLLLERHLDVETGIRLWRRALSVESDPELQLDLAGRLQALGRHRAAGDLLRSGDIVDERLLAEALVGAGDAYARGGDSSAAESAYREAAGLNADDPSALERLAAIHHWAPNTVSAEQASKAYLKAAARHKRGSKLAAINTMRAFDVARSYDAAADAYAALLIQQGRVLAADEVWQRHAIASRRRRTVAEHRIQVANARGAYACSLAAALDACIHSSDGEERSEALLKSLLSDEQALTALIGASHYDDTPKLLEAATTKSGMGRAGALAELAASAQGELRAVLLSFAADSYATAGNMRRARTTAEEAYASAPWLPRTHAALMALGSSIPLNPAAIETAVAHLPASAELYRLLADRWKNDGQAPIAAAWLACWASMQPASATVMGTWLDLAAETESADLIEEAILHTLSIARPLDELSSELRRCLDVMVELDRERASQLANQLFKAVGATNEALWPTLHNVAQSLEQQPLQVALLAGRAADQHMPAHRCAEMYLAAAESCIGVQQWEAAAEFLCRAASIAIDTEHLDTLIERVEENCQSESADERARGDTLQALWQARALRAEHENDEAAVEAWRKLGALRWNLSEDADYAEEAFFRAYQNNSANDRATSYTQDLFGRFGAEWAVAMVSARAERDIAGHDGEQRGKLFACAARLAYANQLHEQTLATALSAIDHAPQSCFDTVALIELLAEHASGPAAISSAYTRLAKAASGAHGQRAAHRRASRVLTQHGAFTEAMKHAQQALDPRLESSADHRRVLWLAQQLEAPASGTSTVPPPLRNRREKAPASRPGQPPATSEQTPSANDDDRFSLRNLVWGSSAPPADTSPPPAAEEALDDPLRRLAWGSAPPAAEAPEPPPAPSEAPSTPEPSRPSRPDARIVPAPAEDDDEPPPSSSRRRAWLPKPLTPEEEALMNELLAGSFAAGEQLVTLYTARDRPRIHDSVAIRRIQATLRLGDRDVLIKLRDAARDDNDRVYTRAIEHVLALFDNSTVSAPPLDALIPQSEATHQLLFADIQGSINEALGVICESGLLRQEVGDYDLSGTDRVPIGAATAVSKVFGGLAQLAGVGGTRLFHRRRNESPLTIKVALLQPLALIVSGRAARETRALRYMIGSGMAAATPSLALIEGLEEARLRDVLAALRTAFGPVERKTAQNITPAQMRLAEDMWHVVPAASERRLRQLCEDGDQVSVNQAIGNCQRVRRRVGLFACGDLRTTLNQVIDELDITESLSNIHQAETASVLMQHPAIADLVDLALTQQYALARWRTAVTQS